MMLATSLLAGEHGNFSICEMKSLFCSCYLALRMWGAFRCDHFLFVVPDGNGIGCSLKLNSCVHLLVNLSKLEICNKWKGMFCEIR